MSKREAEFYLTDRNYDAYNEDEDDDGEGNTFKRASAEVLSKRKIKPLRRRARAAIKQNSDKPSSLASFSFKAPTTKPFSPSTTTTTTSNTTTTTTTTTTTINNTSTNDNTMKDKVKKFTEQICGLNESFVSFLSKSIKEDIVFDISLNINQYQSKRNSIEKEYEDVIKYLTNNKNALKPNNTFTPTTTTTTTTTSSTTTFSFGKPADSTKSSTTAPITTFSFGKPADSAKSSTTAPITTFSFGKPADSAKSSTTAPTTTFSFGKPADSTKSSTTAPTTTFSFGKPADSTKSSTITSTTTFSFGKPADSNKSASTAPTFSFAKPEENKDKDASSKPTVPVFKPFTFNFGQKVSDSGDQGKTLPKPNFAFGVTPPSKDEIAAAAAAAENDDEEDEPSEQAQLTTGAGEEDEDTVFEIKAKIHHYDVKENKYVSRGVGHLKVNKNKKTNKARLLARMDNGTLLLNVSLFKEMVVNDPGDANQFSFNAMDRLEDSDEVKMIRFAVRVKDKESAKKLYNAIIENKN